MCVITQASATQQSSGKPQSQPHSLVSDRAVKQHWAMEPQTCGS